MYSEILEHFTEGHQRKSQGLMNIDKTPLSFDWPVLIQDQKPLFYRTGMVVEHCFTIAYGILVGFGVRAGSEKKNEKR